jgi:N-acetylmuramoyl-L-alanine amidase CwlA
MQKEATSCKLEPFSNQMYDSAMLIKQNLVPPSKYALKSPDTMSPLGICVHNTANDAPAKNEIAFMVSNPAQTSYHFAVDDIEVWQGLPVNRHGWHAGDGKREGNLRYIGVEICYSRSGGERFDKAEENAAELIAQLLQDHNMDIKNVKKHQDFSGKYCPARTLDLGWDRFLNKIKSKMGGEMPEKTITVNQSDWDRLLKASTLGDKLISGLGEKGNIADKNEGEVERLVNEFNRTKQDKQNAQDEVKKVRQEMNEFPQKLADAELQGFNRGYQKGLSENPGTVTPVEPSKPTYPNPDPDKLYIERVIANESGVVVGYEYSVLGG